MLLFSPFGTTKEVSVIDKERLQLSFRALQEDCLAIVCMSGANINEPCQPEALVVDDPLKACARENLEQPRVIPAQESRTKAQA